MNSKGISVLNGGGNNKNIMMMIMTIILLSRCHYPVQGVGNPNTNTNNVGRAAKPWDGPSSYNGSNNNYPGSEEDNDGNSNYMASTYSPNRPPGSAASNPIDYDFQQRNPNKSSDPSTDTSSKEGINDDDDDEEVELPPQTTLEEDEKNIDGDLRRDNEYYDGEGERKSIGSNTMSARRDALAMYRKNDGFYGKIKLSMASTLVGGLLGMFIDKSLFGPKNAMILTYLGGITFFACSTFLYNNDYGEWISTLGLTILFLMRRIRYVRQQYPTRPYIMALLFRRNDNNNRPLQFPPNTDNPWQYEPVSENDPDFNMLRSVIAMALVGTTCGGSLPLLPTWMGAMMGALSFAYITTTSQGHLARIMAMRVVTLIEEALDIQRQLNVTAKTKVVIFKILDKCLILDRKHRIKDKLVAFLTFLYNKVMQIQSDISSSNNNNSNNNESPRNRPNPTFRNDSRDDSRFRGPPPPQYRRGRDLEDDARFQDRRPPPRRPENINNPGRRGDDDRPNNDFDRRRYGNDRSSYDTNNQKNPPTNRNNDGKYPNEE